MRNNGSLMVSFNRLIVKLKWRRSKRKVKQSFLVIQFIVMLLRSSTSGQRHWLLCDRDCWCRCFGWSVLSDTSRTLLTRNTQWNLQRSIENVLNQYWSKDEDMHPTAWLLLRSKMPWGHRLWFTPLRRLVPCASVMSGKSVLAWNRT